MSLLFDYNKSNTSFIPSVAYKFIPEENDFTNELGGKIIRRIFKVESNAYSSFEKQKLEEFFKFIQSKNYSLPDNYGEQDILRQLQGNDYNVPISFDNVKIEINFKSSNLPIQINDDIMHILNSGFMYFHGRDNHFRPLIFFNPAKYNKQLFPFKSWENALEFFIEFLINNCLIPGLIENWNIIVDCGELSVTKLPLDLKEIFKQIKGVYRCRLFKLYLINLSSMLLFAWNLAKAIIGPTIEAKASQVNKDDGKYNSLFQLINRGQVEKKYGGYAPNLGNGDYFPIKFLFNEYDSEDDKINNNYKSKREIDIFHDKETKEDYYESFSDYE